MSDNNNTVVVVLVRRTGTESFKPILLLINHAYFSESPQCVARLIPIHKSVVS